MNLKKSVWHFSRSVLHLLFTVFSVTMQWLERIKVFGWEKRQTFWTIMLLKPSEALALSAAGNVTASLAAHRTLNAKKEKQGPPGHCEMNLLDISPFLESSTTPLINRLKWKRNKNGLLFLDTVLRKAMTVRWNCKDLFSQERCGTGWVGTG